MTYKIINITTDVETGTCIVKCIKQVTADGTTHDLGLHRFSATMEQDLSDFPTNVASLIESAREAWNAIADPNN